MKKLSLTRILEDLDADLEDFSREMEEDGESLTPWGGHVQDVWGGEKLSDNPDQHPGNSGEVYRQHGITSDQMTGWLDRVAEEGFTPELYKEIESSVGDVDNFMLDVQEAMPQIYAHFENSGLQKAIPKLDANPNSNKLGKPGEAPLSLQGAMDQAGQASWDDLADYGRETQDSDPVRREWRKWQEDRMRAQQFGKPVPPPPKMLPKQPEMSLTAASQRQPAAPLGTHTSNMLNHVQDPAQRERVKKQLVQTKGLQQQNAAQQQAALNRQQQAAYPTPQGSDAPTNPAKKIRK